jgi:hypothetical protein
MCLQWSLLSPPPYPSLSGDCVAINERSASVAKWNRRSGDETLERKPLIAQLGDSKSMEIFQLQQRVITRNLKRPHSKDEEPDCLFHRNFSLIMMAT